MKKLNNIAFTLVALPFSFTANISVFQTMPIISLNIENVIVTIKNANEEDEVLWLARVIFSETKDIEEMEKIAWIVRNRVEDGRWGYSYKDVVLSPSQFSGLNSWDSQYHININLDHTIDNSIWQRSLEIAEDVYNADRNNDVPHRSVQHFYSPNVVSTPTWAENEKPVFITYSTTGKQTFKFYAGIK